MGIKNTEKTTGKNRKNPPKGEGDKVKFGKRTVAKLVMFSPEAHAFLKEWAEELHFSNTQSPFILVESLIRDAMQKHSKPKIHKSFRLVEESRGRPRKQDS